MKRKFIIISFVLIVIVFIAHAIFLAAPAEDSFISFRYAKNLVEGYGLTWNIGEPPVEGYTNFLWVLICAIGTILKYDIILFAQIIGVSASVLTLTYVYKISILIGMEKRIALLPCIFLSISGPFAAWATSGMETNLFTLFVVCSTYQAIYFWKSGNSISLIISFILCLLATLIRPEGFGIYLLMLIIQFIFYLRSEPSAGNIKLLFVAALFYLIPFLFYFIWRFTYFGEFLPLTFYAKTGGTIFQWFRGLKYFGYFIIHYLLPFLPMLIYLFLKRRELFSSKKIFFLNTLRKPFSLTRFIISFLILICLAYTSYIIYVGGDYMAMYRFYVPILPFIYILLAAGFILKKKSEGTSKNSLLAVVFILIALVGTIIQSTPLEKIFFRKPGITHGQYQGILTERWHSNRLTLIGKFFNRYKKSNNESLATGAIGALSYYSKLKVYDIYGLVDPHIAKMTMEDLGKGFPGHEKIDLLYTLSKKPTYFIFSREFTNEPADYPSFSPEVDTILKKDYLLVSKWLKDKENDEEGYFTFLELKRIN